MRPPSTCNRMNHPLARENSKSTVTPRSVEEHARNERVAHNPALNAIERSSPADADALISQQSHPRGGSPMINASRRERAPSTAKLARRERFSVIRSPSLMRFPCITFNATRTCEFSRPGTPFRASDGGKTDSPRAAGSIAAERTRTAFISRPDPFLSAFQRPACRIPRANRRFMDFRAAVWAV